MIALLPNHLLDHQKQALHAHQVESVNHGGQFDSVLDDQEPDANANTAHEVLLYHLAVYQGEDVAAHRCDLTLLVSHEGQR